MQALATTKTAHRKKYSLDSSQKIAAVSVDYTQSTAKSINVKSQESVKDLKFTKTSLV